MGVYICGLYLDVLDVHKMVLCTLKRVWVWYISYVNGVGEWVYMRQFYHPNQLLNTILQLTYGR